MTSESEWRRVNVEWEVTVWGVEAWSVEAWREGAQRTTWAVGEGSLIHRFHTADHRPFPLSPAQAQRPFLSRKESEVPGSAQAPLPSPTVNVCDSAYRSQPLTCLSLLFPTTHSHSLPTASSHHPSQGC